jgi:hypothetical protein
MSDQESDIRHVGKAGWFAVGALTASLAFVMLIVAGDYFRATGNERGDVARNPDLIIEAR